MVVAAVETIKPTVLIGVSTRGGLMSREVVEAMSLLNERPIIFPLSNPTRKTECTPEQAYTWSKGKVLYASGVQFPDVKYQGQTFHPGQGNNFYIYPAIGLATYVARPSRITDECFILAAQATADQIDPDLRDKGWLYSLSIEHPRDRSDNRNPGRGIYVRQRSCENTAPEGHPRVDRR